MSGNRQHPDAAEQTSQCEQFRRENVTPHFDKAYAEITANPYSSQMEFLVDYHGRDLLKEFHQWLWDQGARLSYDNLCGELIPAALQEYEENRNVFGKGPFSRFSQWGAVVRGIGCIAVNRWTREAGDAAPSE